MNLNIVPNPIADFNVTDVLQIRNIVVPLELPAEDNAKTTVQIGLRARYCTDGPDVVASIVNQARAAAGLGILSQLVLPGGGPVWFAGDQAQGPVHLSSGEIGDGIHSAFLVGSLLTRVRNMPEEVAQVIQAANGAVLPITDVVA